MITEILNNILSIFQGYEKLVLAILLTIAPITELRAGLPLAMNYAFETGVPVLLIFFLIVLVNILMIFVLFFFLDHLHEFMVHHIKSYRKIFNHWFNKARKKADKLEAKHGTVGFLALMLFVAVPLPGTGAWTGCLVAWLLGLERKRSILAISAGVFIAGLIIFLGIISGRSLFLNFL